jgi:subfamily B ATP-binding cassette protein HlyB/CyaB
MMTAVRTSSTLFLLWLGGGLVVKGSITQGTMLALNSLTAMFLQPVTSLIASWQHVQLARASLERITDVLQAEPEQSPSVACSLPPLTGALELRNVSFRYDANGPEVIRDISLCVRAGQKSGLGGPDRLWQKHPGKTPAGLVSADPRERFSSMAWTFGR